MRIRINPEYGKLFRQILRLLKHVFQSRSKHDTIVDPPEEKAKKLRKTYERESPFYDSGVVTAHSIGQANH